MVPSSHHDSSCDCGGAAPLARRGSVAGIGGQWMECAGHMINHADCLPGFAGLTACSAQACAV